jgi:hypothetical protein
MKTWQIYLYNPYETYSISEILKYQLSGNTNWRFQHHTIPKPADGQNPLTVQSTSYFSNLYIDSKSRGSSGSIESDYGLDDRGSIPDRGRGFFF